MITKVDDRQKALPFYTSVVGFVKKPDIPIDEVLAEIVARTEAPR